jgi:hypothetical protein
MKKYKNDQNKLNGKLSTKPLINLQRIFNSYKISKYQKKSQS